MVEDFFRPVGNEILPEDHRDQSEAALGQRVQHQPTLSSGTGQTGQPQLPHVVGHQVLSLPDHPGQVADAQLATGQQRGRDTQPGRITERPCHGRRRLQRGQIGQTGSDRLRVRQVQAQQVARVGFSADINILTTIEMSRPPAVLAVAMRAGSPTPGVRRCVGCFVVVAGQDQVGGQRKDCP